VLLEREKEQGELRSAFESVVEGKGCVVGIEAAAGLGKTRLLQEARAGATEAGLGVMAGRATELEQDFPFALVRQLLGPQIAGLSTEEQEQVFEGAAAAHGALGLGLEEDRAQDAFAVLHALYWVTAALAERGPMLLAIDDAHSADAASLDYLGFLLPRLEELPVLLVLAGRPDEADPSGGFRRLMTDGVVRHLALAPLSAEASAALLAAELETDPAAEFASACFEVSGGNPFLLNELARTVVQRGIEPLPENADQIGELVPERVAQTVLMRLERLSPTAGETASSLAVLGDDPDPRLVADLAGISAAEASTAADELRAAAILEPTPTLRFVHPLVRSAIYLNIPAGKRADTHLKAARILREAEASPERIATQLLVSEPQGEGPTVETLIEAAARAIDRGAPRSAIAYLSRALREPPPAEMRASVLEPLISALVTEPDSATFAAIENDVQAELEKQPALRSSWALPLSLAMGLNGKFEEATLLLGDAVKQAVTDGDVERAFVLGEQHNALAAVSRLPPLDLSGFPGKLEPSSSAGRLAAAVEARSAVGAGSSREAAEAAMRALGDDLVLHDLGPEAIAVVAVVLTLVGADEVAFARAAMGRTVAANRDRGATGGLVRALMLSSIAAWGEGEVLAAEPDIRQAMDLARSSGSTPLLLLLAGVLVEILVERDELGQAQWELEALNMGAGPMPESPMFTVLRYARGHLRVERGELDLSLEDLAALTYEKGRWDFGNLNVSFASPLAARVLRARDDLQSIAELVASVEPVARRWGAPSTTAHFLRTRAAARDGQEAIDDFEAAVAALEGSPRRLELVNALIDLGQALRRAGRRADARSPLRRALDLARRSGAARAARRAHEELQATGEKVRRYTPIGVESLTPSERRVAELAASGMTNRQIAQSLFVTVKTVEAHLSAAYDKLDIGSRRELPEALVGPAST
jgi:DNA-binding CsgD family transcriptional regulator